jgi:hypothetical protein
MAVESKFKLVNLAELVELDRQLAGAGLDLTSAGKVPIADKVERRRVNRLLEAVAIVFPGKRSVSYGPGGRRLKGSVRWYWSDGAPLFAQHAGELSIPEGYEPCPEHGRPKPKPKRRAARKGTAKVGR